MKVRVSGSPALPQCPLAVSLLPATTTVELRAMVQLAVGPYGGAADAEPAKATTLPDTARANAAGATSSRPAFRRGERALRRAVPAPA